MGERRFGLSTHLFHDHRLTREHLALVARHGFEAIEVVRHADALRLPRRRGGGEPGRLAGRDPAPAPLGARADRRGRAARRDGGAVLHRLGRREPPRRRRGRSRKRRSPLAARIPFRVLVLHLGVPDVDAPAGQRQPAGRGAPQPRGDRRRRGRRRRPGGRGGDPESAVDARQPRPPHRGRDATNSTASASVSTTATRT